MLVTDSEVARQQAELVGAGLADRFPLVVGTDTTGLPEPQPAPFRAACALLGLEPAAVLHVGDDLVSDVAGADSAGLQARWLERTGRAAGAVRRRARDRPPRGLAAAGLSRGPGRHRTAPGSAEQTRAPGVAPTGFEPALPP